MSNVENVFQVVSDLILELKDVDEDGVTLDTTIESLALDSLDFVELQLVVKKKVGVALDPQAFASRAIATLRQLCEYVVEVKEAEAVPA